MQRSEFMNFADETNEKSKDQNVLMEKMLGTRSVLLTGQVNKEMAERVSRQMLILEAAGDDPIKVFIDSQGGDADSGFAILDMLRFVTPEIYTIGMGLVASAGAIILLGAEKDNRIGLPNSHYLIHQPLSGVQGVATEIEIFAQEIDKMRQKINTLIAEETGQPMEKVKKDTDRDYWMSPDEAIEYGLISKVVTKRKELDI